MATTTNQTVGSHITVIQFGPANIPIGFLASFRKKKHLMCEPGRGFVIQRVAGGERQNVVCDCAVFRARDRMTRVGTTAFEALGQEWLITEKQRLANNEAACREEGRQAAPGAECPYPEGTDQRLAWTEGRSGAKGQEVSGEKT